MDTRQHIISIGSACEANHSLMCLNFLFLASLHGSQFDSSHAIAELMRNHAVMARERGYRRVDC